MGWYAEIREDYLKDHNPRLYRELKLAGRLKAHCLERELKALERKQWLIASGEASDDLADEIALAGILRE